MYLNFKIILVLLFTTQLAWTQQNINTKEQIETEQKQEKRNLKHTLGLSFFQPIYYGDNFINQAYSLNLGFDIDLIAYNIFKKFTLHINFKFNSGDVNRPELVGNIDSSNFTRISSGFGYFFQLNEKIHLLPSLNVGYVRLRNQLNFTEEISRDDGIFIGLKVEAVYTINNWLYLNLGIGNDFDFFNIESAPQDDAFFNNALSIYPFVGVKIKL